MEAKNIVADKYAIFKAGGKQYQAIPGKTLALSRLNGEAGDAIEFSEVLLRKDSADNVKIGTPLVEGAVVKASIIKHDRGPKVTVFKRKRRKKYRVKKGYRDDITVIRFESI